MRHSILVIGCLLMVAGCSSGELKARQEQRERIVQSSKLYCEFVNGDNNHDIDVAINLAMGAKCDAEKSFSMTNYRTPSEINGVLFCCGIRTPKAPESAVKAEPKMPKHQAPEVTPVVPVAPEAKPAAKPLAPVSGVSTAPATGVPSPTGAPAEPVATPIPKVEFVDSSPSSGQ